MNDLVNLIIKKTGIPAATAQIIVNMVITFIKKKLPASVGSQIDMVLVSGSAVKSTQNMLGNLTSQLGKKKK